MSKYRLSLLLALGLVQACSCGDDGTVSGTPELRVDPTALTFEACPTKDESGATVQDVFPAQALVKLSNLGNVTANLTIDTAGEGAERFFVPEDQRPTSLGASQDIEFPVHFSPTQAGAVSAELVVDDGIDATEPARVLLSGTGLSLPAQPTLEVSYQLPGTDSYEPCLAGVVCDMQFPSTYYGQSTTLNLKVKNTGCPTLKITGVELSKSLFGGGNNLAFFVDQPAILPSTQTPVLLSTSSSDELLLQIRFQPESDDSGGDQRYGQLKLLTNDPLHPEFSLQLGGLGAAPAVYTVPNLCNFSDPSDTCGNSPSKIPNKAHFTVENGGNTDIVVTAALEGGGQGRFSLASPLSNVTVPVGGSVPLDVNYTEPAGAVFVSQRLVVTATAGGMPAGEAVIFLSGGTQPALSTDPDNQLDFVNPSQTVSSRTVRIQNGAGAGTLVLNRVFVDPNPYFSVLNPPAAGTQVAPGANVEVQVQYTKPVTGGVQSGVLRIDSNDPDYGPPPYKVITLYSEAPLDQVPVAAIQVRVAGSTEWRDSPVTQSLGQIPGATKALELSCDPSTDPLPGGGQKKVKQCEFRLVKKPAQATSAYLEFDGQKVDAYRGDSTPAPVKLVLGANVVGEYNVDVYAYDDSGQRSGSPARMVIYTQP